MRVEPIAQCVVQGQGFASLCSDAAASIKTGQPCLVSPGAAHCVSETPAQPVLQGPTAAEVNWFNHSPPSAQPSAARAPPPCPSPPPQKRHTRAPPSTIHRGAPSQTRPRPEPNKRKKELDLLRIQHFQLLELVQKLSNQKQHDDRSASQWKLIAKYQAVRRHQALQQNAKLRQALREQQQLTELLQRLFGRVDPCRQKLGSVEDFEWRVGVLSKHPQRRKFNADRILNAVYATLPTSAIRNGTLEACTPMRFSKASNVELLDQTVFQEVNMCALVPGHFAKLAQAYWAIALEVLTLGDRVFALNQLSERFDETTSYWQSTIYFGSPPSRPMECAPQVTKGPMNRTISRRVSTSNSVTSFFMNVRETADETPGNLALGEDATGWFTLQDAGCDAQGNPVSVFKCNMCVQFKPITHRLNGLVQLANQMQLGQFPDPSLLDYSSRIKLEKQLRQVLLQFLVSIMWNHIDQQEATVRECAHRLQQAAATRS